MATRPTALELRELRRKYERMLALRSEVARARVDPTFEEAEPRAARARLAADYPGSLREIDTLPIDLIHGRIALLERTEIDVELAEPWMNAQIYFHRVGRGALIAKRWLRGRREVTPELRSEFAKIASTLGADAALVADDLEAVALPPNGRLTTFVCRKVARLLGQDEAEVRALVFLPRAELLGGRP